MTDGQKGIHVTACSLNACPQIVKRSNDGLAHAGSGLLQIHKQNTTQGEKLHQRLISITIVNRTRDKNHITSNFGKKSHIYVLKPNNFSFSFPSTISL